MSAYLVSLSPVPQHGVSPGELDRSVACCTYIQQIILIPSFLRCLCFDVFSVRMYVRKHATPFEHKL